MMKDYARLAIIGIRRRKVRSWLTMIGIFIGIIAVVSLISLGEGMQAAVEEQLKKVGSNRIMVTPGGGEISSPVTSELVSAKLYERDVDTVRSVRGIDYAIGVVAKTVRVKFGDETKYTMAFASDTDQKTIDFIKNIEFFAVDKGRYPKEGEKYKAIIGPDLAKDFFDEEIRIGDKILIEGREFEVVVITKKSGNPLHDNKVAIPMDTAQEMFNTTEISTIFAETQKGFDPVDVAKGVEKALRKDHGVEEGKEDFTVQTAQQVVKRFQTILDMVQVVLVGIAAVSLLVGGVGIMNTMYTSVLDLCWSARGT
jgi:putative ABC transport system permease protein